ncbi:hypothetical protein [Antribacter gilvus]|uniref:PH-like domain-containing protein n=1 Tax=Antribacter gilvus TaxID=2304675 RepID=UPI000F7B3D9E|nr:hypothetical protein [Antribacter gilvus]
MTQPVAMAIVALLGLVLLYAVLTGRRRLARRTRALVPPPPAVPSTLGLVRVGPIDATYVSSTLAGDWLARIGAHGLGDRSSARVSVYEPGVLIEREGAEEIFIPVETVEAAGLGPGMAGKYVGTDGLVVITWEVPADPDVPDVPATVIDTGLRTRRATDRGALVDAVRHLVAAQTHPYPEEAR